MKDWEKEQLTLAARSGDPKLQGPALMVVLLEILETLQAIREAAETEAVEDAEPDTYQTLNGPRFKTVLTEMRVSHDGGLTWDPPM